MSHEEGRFCYTPLAGDKPLSLHPLCYEETLPVASFSSEVRWPKWIARYTSEDSLHPNTHICATWKQSKGIKTVKAKNPNVLFRGLKFLLYAFLVALKWKDTWSFSLCAEYLILRVLAAPLLVLSASPVPLEFWCSTHVLRTCRTNLIVYIFTIARRNKKPELSDFLLLMHGVATELTSGAALSNWRAHANVWMLSGWEITFPWAQTSDKWHDIWKWLLQDWVISALRTSDSLAILNAKTSTSSVNIKQNNGLSTNVWTSFRSAWEKSPLCLLQQKKHLFFPSVNVCLLWVVVNSDTQSPVCACSALCGWEDSNIWDLNQETFTFCKGSRIFKMSQI